MKNWAAWRAAALALALAVMPAGLRAADPAWDRPHAANPLLPGYFADPTIVHNGRRWTIFATADPWGGDHLAMWQSTNGRDWTWSQPTWPSKAAATSPTSGDAMVWAPSVVKGRDGRWWMYVSVGSEVWVGSAPAPGGPWADANHGRPLIPGNFRPGFHMIDAEAFIDRDGQAWLAWGSGLNWVNGHCFVVRLAADMVHFAGPVEDVTPAHYFEAPFLFRARDGYVLSYSAGNTTRDTYQVRYATGPSPRGPFIEAPNSPILQTQPGDAIISPGHHAFFRSGDRAFILYHRQALPWRAGQPETLRQVAVDGLEISPGPRLLVRGRWGPGGDHAGVAVPGWAAHRTAGLPWRTVGGQGSAASDDNFATLWRPGVDRRLVADLGRVRALRETWLRPEFPDRAMRVALSTSRDGRHWRVVTGPVVRNGSPIPLGHNLIARYLRLDLLDDKPMGLWEWTMLPL